MQKIWMLILLLIFIGVLPSCNNPAENNLNTDANKVKEITEILTDTLNKDEYAVYIIPSPFQVTALLKVMDVEYLEYLIEDTKSETFHPHNSYLKSLSLGVYTVDLGYAYTYGQHQTSINFLNKIKTLSEDLGMTSATNTSVLERISTNLSNPDSVNILAKEFVETFDINAVLHQDKKNSLFVLCGYYIEGLYHLIEIYKEQAGNKAFNTYLVKNMNNALPQQERILKNLVALLQEYDEVEVRRMIGQLNLITKEFEHLNIMYSQNTETGKIADVKIKTEEIASLESIVQRVRKGIIS